MQKIHVSDQYAQGSVIKRDEFADTSVPVIESALQHVNLNRLGARGGSGQGVSFSELPVTGLLVLRAQKDKPALQSALQSVCQLALPDTLRCSVSSASISSYSQATDNPLSGNQCVRWIAPDEWMLSCLVQDAFAIETKLRETLANASVAIVNVTGGYSVFTLSGPDANHVLKKSTAYDVHPNNFEPGKVVNTVFAKAQVCLRCVDAGKYELIVRRSFTDYLWHWIQVSSAEYGLGIST